LRIEEKDIIIAYEKRKAELLAKEIRRRITEEKLANYNERINQINDMPYETVREKRNKIEAWYDCIKSLGVGIIN
jgi:hypothetical protein